MREGAKTILKRSKTNFSRSIITGSTGTVTKRIKKEEKTKETSIEHMLVQENKPIHHVS